MKMLFLLCGFALVTFQIGCTSTQKRNYSFIGIPRVLNTDGGKVLTKEQLLYDKEQVLYSLENVYSGRKFLPNNEHKILLEQIRKIDGSLTVQEFCERIAAAFDRVSDSHLGAAFGGKGCVKNSSNRDGSVGKNLYEGGNIPWAVKIKKRSGANALLISITNFHKRSSPVWDGFLETVKSELPKANLVVIDMRGNGGGDDSIGYELSALLAGPNLKTPYNEQWTSSNPESFQIFVNTFDYWGRKHKENKGSVPPYIAELKQKFISKRNRALKGEVVSIADNEALEAGSEERQDFNFEKSIKRPIYLLVDADCASSCESTVDFFEFNPLARVVGENTAGYIHFGNNGNVFLKNSGIKLQMAVSYNSYYDGRFVEKVGITPSIKVSPGKDALDIAWKTYFDWKRQGSKFDLDIRKRVKH